jgi:hypothetical protein
VNPGELLIENLPAATTVEFIQGTTTLVPPATLDLVSQTATLLYAVGTASNNTVNLENKIVKNVI